MTGRPRRRRRRARARSFTERPTPRAEPRTLVRSYVARRRRFSSERMVLRWAASRARTALSWARRADAAFGSRDPSRGQIRISGRVEARRSTAPCSVASSHHVPHTVSTPTARSLPRPCLRARETAAVRQRERCSGPPPGAGARTTPTLRLSSVRTRVASVVRPRPAVTGTSRRYGDGNASIGASSTSRTRGSLRSHSRSRNSSVAGSSRTLRRRSCSVDHGPTTSTWTSS